MSQDLSQLLKAVANQTLTPQEAEKLIKKHMIVNVDDFAQFDLYRDSRSGVPEVIYAEKKSPEMCKEIINSILSHKSVVLITRLSKDHIQYLKSVYTSSKHYKIDLNEIGKLATISVKDYIFPQLLSSKVGIITAGSSDIPVAYEAKAILKLMAIDTVDAFDIGVAGLHRIIKPLQNFVNENIDTLIVIAGMEGALPSVIAGLVDIPVIGVPTSIGYGIKPPGEVALLSMLSSCSPGLAVVNVDAGFSAGAFAGLIAKKISKTRIENTK